MVIEQKWLRGILPLSLLGMVACGGNGGDTPPDECLANPDCASCVADGACCQYSINCQAGSICNQPTEDLYDATKDMNICIKVVCQSDADCESGKKCSLEKICKPPTCQTNSECSGGQLCLDGQCTAAPNVSDVASCEVVTPAGAIRQGATVTLSAVAKNANGKVLSGIPFTWASGATNRVSVAGNVGTGGTEQGVAVLSAKPTGSNIDCARPVSITNFPNVPAGSARVVVVADDLGTPVVGASVSMSAGGDLTGTTDANGSATFTVPGAVASVTVVQAGYQLVSVVSPGTNDLFIPLPRLPDVTKAGGIHGAIDLASTRKADIQLGLAGPAIPSNLLNFGTETFTNLIGDFVPTVIMAPELGLDDAEPIDLPGGLVLGLGNKRFTADAARCQGLTPSATELGCYLTRLPAGSSAVWSLAGQLKLSDVTSIANELSGAIGGEGDLPIGDILTAVLPLLRSLNHGLIASVFTTEHPKVNKAGQTGNCADPNLVDYDDKCGGDASKYPENSLAASQKLGILSKVAIPNLPALPGAGSRCAAGAVLLAGAAVPGRGLVPLGLTAGVDTLEMTETANCKVAGTEKPFGPTSPDLPEGQMPLSMAPPHSGIEGSDVFLLLVALDPDSIGGDTGVQLSALVRRPTNNQVGETETFSGEFLTFPEGTLNKAGASFAYTAGLTGATMSRIQVGTGERSWYIYAPASANSVTLPDVAEGRALLATSNGAYIMTMKMDGQYNELWQFGSGKTLDQVFDTIQGFVLQECNATAGTPCQIQ